MSQYITVSINGQPFNCNSFISLKDLLIYLNFDLSSVIIEYNNEIIKNFNYINITINDGDRIEVITIVGGG
uniref:Thiamin biosynthesis protein S n=1 Tax=Platysiphonia delicata TaxID=2006979 RepID=A0A1Z1M0P6_9FLOR|nr:thiamin biosynthesis protein S [Platysiphonia delicata]ARW59678.1 thiamin biosynthesis protein S [Platysiphonia delicata]